MGLYDFAVPSTVKAWFDRLVVPGLTLARESPAMIPLDLGSL